ncbi:MAG: M23 family metallopeptidase [Candidatus Sericytochromatia bacterium]
MLKKKLFILIIVLASNIQVNNVSANNISPSWIKPVEGTIPNPFGNNYEFYDVYRAGHTGVDITSKVGTEVHAVGEGIVKFIKTKPNMRYGNYIVLEHNNGLFTLYGHLKNVLVTIDEVVKQGQIIGHSGMSGLASYPHVHFEVIDRVPVRDGAWGYNYICERRNEEIINKERSKRLFFERMPVYDFLPISTIQEKFSFLGVDSKHMEHFYRMKDNICVEKPISPITYYNPENYLPKYDKSTMPHFGHIPE